VNHKEDDEGGGHNKKDDDYCNKMKLELLQLMRISSIMRMAMMSKRNLFLSGAIVLPRGRSQSRGLHLSGDVVNEEGLHIGRQGLRVSMCVCVCA
jgi:hypothetical protein